MNVELHSLFTPHNAETKNLGPTIDRKIQSSVMLCHTLPDYQVVYPQAVVQALCELYTEYNLAFRKLVEANREWSDDYHHLMYGPDCTPVNFAVQIDMLGLPEWFLQEATTMPVNLLRELLRGTVFEIENSLAMYQLLERTCANGDGPSYFQPRFRQALDELRRRHGKPIALLAVTQQKYQAMRESEFGKQDGDALSNQEVRDLSGFDYFFGPDEFRHHVQEKGGCEFMLYVRSSDPVAKLKKPKLSVDHPLLGDAQMRRVIKANAITFNVDAPEMQYPQRINDTKEYMGPLGMGYEISRVEDLMSGEVCEHLATSHSFEEYHGQRLSDGFAQYLARRGMPMQAIESGSVHLRAKPAKGTYGCYGHVRGPLSSGAKFRKDLAYELRQRGGTYVVQPEMTTPQIVNTKDGVTYTYIDRNFLAFTNGHPVFLGGFRSMLPVDTNEAHKGRVHGNRDTVWAEIVA